MMSYYTLTLTFYKKEKYLTKKHVDTSRANRTVCKENKGTSGKYKKQIDTAFNNAIFKSLLKINNINLVLTL